MKIDKQALRKAAEGNVKYAQMFINPRDVLALLDELEAVFKREKQFTSDVSHELRTPISVMMAQCGQLLKDEALKPKQKAQVKHVRSDRAASVFIKSRSGASADRERKR